MWARSSLQANMYQRPLYFSFFIFLLELTYPDTGEEAPRTPPGQASLSPPEESEQSRLISPGRCFQASRVVSARALLLQSRVTLCPKSRQSGSSSILGSSSSSSSSSRAWTPSSTCWAWYPVIPTRLTKYLGYSLMIFPSPSFVGLWWITGVIRRGD